MPIRTLIVDDEPLARRRLRRLLGQEPDFEVVGEARDGAEAIAIIGNLRPHLVFLDVQMPEVDGFHVLEAIPARELPVIVFVTAHDQHAVRAFDVHALDYLVKPFDEPRFQLALQRARTQLQRASSGELNRRLLSLLDEIKTSPDHVPRLLINTGGRVFFLQVDEIDWVEAYGNYVRLHVKEHSYLLRETIMSLRERLDPELFFRIHRSTLVNVDRIKELRPLFRGDYQVLLKDGTELKLSRTYRDQLKHQWGAEL